MTRLEVEQSQRERLLAGAADAVAEKGYAAASVADIIQRAGVSRTTFYELYRDKQDCFLAASRLASDVVTSVIADELVQLTEGPELTALDRVDRLLQAYLQTLVDFPVLARVFLVEVYAAGQSAIEQRRAALDGFVDLLAEELRTAPAHTAGPVDATDRAGVSGPADATVSAGSADRADAPGPADATDRADSSDRADERLVAEVLVAAVSSLVTNAVAVGEGERLMDLHRPLMKVASRVIATD